MRSPVYIANSFILLLLAAGTMAQSPDEGGPLDQTVPVAEDDVTPAANDSISEEAIVEAFAYFKELQANGMLDEADLVAKQLVEMTIRLYGPESSEVAKALTNLAIVQHRSKQFDAAQQNFAAAIEIIEDVDDRLSTSLVNPLKGLGAAQLEGGRPELAARTYNRAVHVTHVNDGPHNMGQVEILESLAETNYRLGLIDDAKKAHERIYALNKRYFASQPMALIQPLMRRAAWQHRTGHYNDERATYRYIVRIIESQVDKNDVKLIEPLLRLGESYYYVDTTATSQSGSAMVNGEIYFKRAHRIAERNQESNWQAAAETKLALADFYLVQASQGRARKLYKEAWDLLSADDARIDTRLEQFGRPVVLRRGALPRYVGKASASDQASQDEQLLIGSVSANFAVTTRGGIANLTIIESVPAEFDDMTRLVQRELRSRLYRPAFIEGVPIDSPNQLFKHDFYYRQSDLERIREQRAEQEAALQNES